MQFNSPAINPALMVIILPFFQNLFEEVLI